MSLDAATLPALFDPKNKTTQQLKPDRQLSQVRFSPCGKYLLAAGHDGLVHRWDVSGDAATALSAIAGHNGWVHALAFRAEGETVISADSWGGLRCGSYIGDEPPALWSIPDAHDGWILGLALGPDGRYIATGGYDRTVRIWNASSGEKVRELIGHATEVFSVAFSGDGQSVFSGDLDGRVKQWSVADGAILREFDASSLHLTNRLQEVGGARTLAASRRGSHLLVGGTKPKNGGNVQGVPTVLVFDSATGSLLRTHEFGKDGDVYVTDLAETADEVWAATISGNPGTGKVVFFRLDDEKPLFETARLPNCHSLAWHPAGTRLAVSATNTGSNGNGRLKDKDGEYPGNHSPVHVFRLPE
jgi:WD40 repeat protein